MDHHYVEFLSVLRRGYKLAPESKPFKLASGKESNHFMDVKKVALMSDGILILGKRLTAIIQAEERNLLGFQTFFHHVAGVALGGCPLATAASIFSGNDVGGGKWNTLYVRKEAKDHGTAKLIEGDFKPGDRVVLVEDVATTGGSSLKAIEALRAAGLVVPLVVAVVDREEGAADAFAKAGVKFVSLVTLSEVANGG